jgi:hypothetical protein
VHVLNLHDEHEPVDADCLLPQDVRFGVVRGCGFLVDEKDLLGFLLAFLVVAVEKQGFAVDHLPVVNQS